MSEIVRFGVSIPEGLLQKFDQYLRRKHYRNRSEAIRDLIREKLVEEEWRQSRSEVVGTITYVYDHHKRELTDRLLHLQHNHYAQIISTQHVHLDHDRCLEVIIVKGPASAVRELADRIKALKGILHCSLSMTTTGKDLL
ncbi:MAG: nickel-responsive transcriptional regulator NikR [Thermodesulfatator sp.]|nr:MAG: nickel-responsive transcriptional regulator NikR [Thermodesulfatator sp.]